MSTDPAVAAYRDEHAFESEEIDFSEDGIALEFTRRYKNDLRFVDEWNRWPRWDGARWKVDRTREVFNLARGVCRRVAEFAPKEHEAKRLRSAQTVAAVLKLACSDRAHALVSEDFDRDPWLLNTPAGTVDLKTASILPHRRSDLITKVTAVAPSGTCRLWDESLKVWTEGDDELIGFLRRYVGYALTGETGEHVFTFSHGGGANGKSTFHSLLVWLLGDYATTASTDAFTESKFDRHPTELAMLRGARMVNASETGHERHWAEAKIKQLTGGEPISARYMRRDFFTYTPQFKLFISGNHRPGLRNVDEAMMRRLLLVPWEAHIPASERDQDLGAKLREEAPGILAWALVGCLEWREVGLRPPARVLEATKAYFSEQDSIGRWLSECCVLGGQFRAAKRDLYQSWSKWAESCGEFAMSKRGLLAELRGRLDVQESTIGKRNVEALAGIGLSEEERQ